ncbi:MAG: LLM class flavin-dependent oxidoreductase, partial [Hyphomicrobiales bacterium]
MVRFGLWYDFRNPPAWRRPLASLYAETFEQIRWAETLGYDDIWTTEHHFVDDDYAPSLLPICAAIAAQTTRVRVGTAVLLLPLHDPVRIAEDAAVVDAISGGRLDLGVGLGYRVAEFAAMNIPTRQRGRRMDEALKLIRRAWSGGTFSFEGEFYRYTNIDVTPKPVQAPMPLWVGGISEPAARRAARLGTGFQAGAGADMVPAYLDECARLSRAPGGVMKGMPFHAVAEDVD